MHRWVWIILCSLTLLGCGGDDQTAERGTTDPNNQMSSNNTNANNTMSNNIDMGTGNSNTSTNNSSTPNNNPTTNPNNNSTMNGGDKMLGAQCSGDCIDGLICANTDRDVSICMTPCQNPGGLCDGGEVCVSLADSDNGICYPGGAKVAGEDCTRNIECQVGFKCIGTNETRVCIKACFADASACDDEQICVKYQGEEG